MKKPLGRGLDTLIPRKTNTLQSDDRSSGLLELDITEIVPNDNQPRRVFDDILLNELAESIKLKGVILPIIVTKSNDGKYMIVEGERRWRASGLAEKKTIPAVVKSVDTEKERLELALITNAQREDLNAIELANAYKELIEKHSYRQEDLGRIVGKSRAAVSNRLRLLTLPIEVCNAVEHKKISEGHARAILSLEKGNDAISFLHTIIDKKLSVRDAEVLAKKINAGITEQAPKAKKAENVELRGITSEFESFFMSKVNIKQKNKGGVIEIKYSSDDELDLMIKKIRGESC